MNTSALRLSCGDHSFTALPHAAAVGLISGLGFSGLDLMLHGNRSHIRPEELAGDLAGCAGRVEELLQAGELELSDVFLIPWTDFQTMAPNHPESAERERSTALFHDALEFAARLGAPGITMLPGIHWPGEPHEESLARAGAELARRVDAAGERGLRCSIEPHVGAICASPADTARLCELVPGLELTVDYTHYVAQGFSEAEIEPLLGRARQFHARGAAPGRGQTPLAENAIDWERAIDALAEAGYGGFLSVEYVWTDGGDLEDVDVASETVIMRDRLAAKLAGRPWVYPRLG